MKRRQLLGGVAGTAGLATLTGCGLFGDDPEPAPAPDALQPVLDEALALAAGYDRAAVADPALKVFGDDHRAHAAELAKLIGATLPSAAPSAPAAGNSKAALRKAEQAAQKTATAACKTAPAERAGIVGSIAAARAAHAEALR
ncbi:hypothetical protein [Actinoplanes sp. TFC3]|uniref:hypothetical protein n=1 Tax=Actinoplanes sp. TFC3 TaxID=1710355 RepID=UPI0008338323|nr:hypothetical protein [Actinoplanes sp. TFC3]